MCFSCHLHKATGAPQIFVVACTLIRFCECAADFSAEQIVDISADAEMAFEQESLISVKKFKQKMYKMQDFASSPQFGAFCRSSSCER